MNIVKNSRNFKWLLLAATCFSSPVFAAGPPQPSTLENPLAQVLLIIMILLALVIAILASVVNGAASVFRDKMREKKEGSTKTNQPVVTTLLVIGSILFSVTSMAQDKAAEVATIPAVSSAVNGLSPLTFYSLVIVLAVEILIIIALVYILKWLMGIGQKESAVAIEMAIVEVPLGVRINKWWNKLNRSIAIEKEKDIDLNHDYDGIRELDNSIPPWWLFGFVFFILFGFGYLYSYHVARSSPLQLEELQIAMEKAEVEKQAYLSLSANNVDENSVKKLDESGIASGKALFTQNCVACHGAEGQGNAVGPNLTDTYWLHGGDIKDVFKTIKYGWPEKGMRSWKEDFSPTQLAELASFVKSLKGTTPPDAKEPQGELFIDTDDMAKPDSSSAGDQANRK
jgi:cytochrome c oxidase cbb3-type subunit 3